MVDIKNLKAKAKAKVNNMGLCVVILGPSGSGKSSAAGSLGKEILFCACSTESHGPVSAGIHGANITPYFIDLNDDGSQKSPDQALTDLVALLSDPTLSANFDTVVIDSLTDYELLVLRSGWLKEFAAGPNGKENSFKRPEGVLTKIQELFSLAHLFRSKGTHFIVTLPAHVTGVSAEGTADTIAPLLSSYAIAERIPRLADVVLYVSQVEVEGQTARAFLFDTEVSRQQKDLGGNVKKYLNFKPSCRGVDDSALPTMMKADLKKIVQLFSKETK